MRSTAVPFFSLALPRDRPFLRKMTAPEGTSIAPEVCVVATRKYCVWPFALTWLLKLRTVTVGRAPTLCVKTGLTDDKSFGTPL